MRPRITAPTPSTPPTLARGAAKPLHARGCVHSLTDSQTAILEPLPAVRESKCVDLSFEETFAAEARPIFHYLRRRVGSNAAEDLTAATFATAYAAWDRRHPDRPVRPWLFGIAANLLRHHWRSERRMLRAYARTGTDPVLPDEEATLARADAQSSHRQLAQALAELRPQDREILLLHAWAELSDSEIAAALELPLGTVKSRLHRTRARLGNRLDPYGQEQTTTLIGAAKEQR